MHCLRLCLTAVCLSCLLPGCSPELVEVVSETDEKQYQLAKGYQAQGRVEEALSAFLRVIDARRDAPESHFEAGYIYLQEMKDPISAIYHFKRYIQLKPDSNQLMQVEQLVETAEKEFARQLPARPYEGQLDRIDLMELLKGLKQENESLKREWVAAQQRVRQLEGMLGGARRASSTSASAAVPQPAVPRVEPAAPVARAASDPATVPRSYTVQSGDSLSSISRKFYGTPSRWIDIYQANRDRMSSENALRVGQDLRIP